jgi:protein-tyrosine phosphatase
VAQPTSTGLATVLTLLGAGPMNLEGKSCTWISTREEPLIYINEEPFVLRDAASPAENIQAYAGISQARLEQMEAKLAQEILDEATQNGGLVLVHDERADGGMAPCFVAIETVKTGSQIFSDLLLKGYRVDYRRVPMTHGFSPVDPFIDEFVALFQTVPLEHSVVFSCGLGIGRTTFGMLVGLLIRRALSLAQTSIDPFERPAMVRAEHHEILRLIYTLEYALGKAAAEHQTAIQWVLERDQIIESLGEALHGNYKCILDLVRVLQDGIACKRVVDEAIDRCQTHLNLREWILINRVKHSVKVQQAIDAATTSMERYFALIALCAYLAASPNDTFTGWMKARPELWNMFVGLRKQRNKLKLFLPIDKLTGITSSLHAEGERDIQEGKVIKSRAGSVLVPHTILKSDLWFAEYKLASVLAGAENFRQVHGFPVYGVAQPRVEGIRQILAAVRRSIPAGDQICWVNIREEPLIYIHGDPYVLRDRFGSLRNMKSFQGIPASRLEQMELRLKDDILNEAQAYANTLLVHTEDADGNIFPIWEAVDGPAEVATISEVFQAVKADFPQTHYFRIPVTAEDAPEPADFDYILRILCSFPTQHVHIIFNCQIGAGRSTTGTIIACQVMSWRAGRQAEDLTYVEQAISRMSTTTTQPNYYKAIQSILRTIRFGLESKLKLDKVVDAAAAVVNIRQAIDDWKERAGVAVDPNEARRSLRKGIAALRRYCLLLLFQAYLDENDPDQEAQLMGTFAEYLGRHPEFEKLLLELEHNRKLETLEIDAEQRLGGEEGHALTSEVASVIKDRRGNVLAPLTILKYDHFPGCQKMSLAERLEGAPNFRKVLMPEIAGVDRLAVYGVAMPKAEAIRLVLEKMQAQQSGPRKALWISLREEPVAFVKGRPFVLRVVKDPVANIEMTGIISERVESMEERLKTDILAELRQFNNNLLLHEEEMGKHGYEVVPVWEHVEEGSIATPAEVYANICKEGYDLTYIRIPMYKQSLDDELFIHPILG